MQRILWLALVLSVMMLVALDCGGNRNTGNVTTTQVNSNSGSVNSNTATSAPKSSPEDASAVIESVHLARDDGRGKVGETVTEFKTTDNPLYCVVQLREPKAGTRLKAEWFAVNAGGERDSMFLEKEFTTTADMNMVTFTARLPRQWPDGDYKVNILVNGKPEKSLDFQIK